MSSISIYLKFIIVALIYQHCMIRDSFDMSKLETLLRKWQEYSVMETETGVHSQ